MQHIVEEFEKRTGKKLKDREKGVLGELMQKELLNILKENLNLSTKTEKVEDFEGITMGYQRKMVLSLGGEEVSSIFVSDLGLRY
jgi:hypothetical protein